MRNICPLLLLSLPLAACRLIEPAPSILASASAERVSVADAATALANCDVVFLGEEHDSAAAHKLQLELTQALAAKRPNLALSLEMFERDVQGWLDLYLRDGIDEATFLARARPWPNYAAHYRPAVEWAKARGYPVLAANCPRPLASRVAKQGLTAVIGDPWCALSVDTSAGAYRTFFETVMGGHQGDAEGAMDRWFAAQCLKDDTMAESIAHHLTQQAAERPLVVHWCGRFHSDGGLGTVERLRRRLPELRIGIVSTLSGQGVFAKLSEEERQLGDYIFLVPAR